MGQSKTNKNIEANKNDAEAAAKAAAAEAAKPSESEAEITRNKNEWNSWAEAHDYRTPPPHSMLGLDLWSPANENKLAAQYQNINGNGGLALAQGGNATAMGMARDHMTAARAERQAADYEKGVKAQDDFYKGNTLTLAQLEQNRAANAASLASNREQFYTNAYIQTAPQPILPTLLGAAIGGASSILTGGISKGGLWGK